MFCFILFVYPFLRGFVVIMKDSNDQTTFFIFLCVHMKLIQSMEQIMKENYCSFSIL